MDVNNLLNAFLNYFLWLVLYFYIHHVVKFIISLTSFIQILVYYLLEMSLITFIATSFVSFFYSFSICSTKKEKEKKEEAYYKINRMDFCCKRIMIFNDAQKSVGWMLRTMVMAWWLGKKKKLSRVTDMNRPRALWRLSQFSLSNTRMVVFVNSKNLPSLNETWSFYRELEVSLLARIHYHHGRCVELMEKMERTSGNPPYVLEW